MLCIRNSSALSVGALSRVWVSLGRRISVYIQLQLGVNFLFYTSIYVLRCKNLFGFAVHLLIPMKADRRDVLPLRDGNRTLDNKSSRYSRCEVRRFFMLPFCGTVLVSEVSSCSSATMDIADALGLKINMAGHLLS